MNELTFEQQPANKTRTNFPLLQMHPDYPRFIGISNPYIQVLSLQHLLTLYQPSLVLLQYARLGIYYNTTTKYTLEGVADVPSDLEKADVMFNYVT